MQIVLEPVRCLARIDNLTSYDFQEYFPLDLAAYHDCRLSTYHIMPAGSDNFVRGACPKSLAGSCPAVVASTLYFHCMGSGIPVL